MSSNAGEPLAEELTKEPTEKSTGKSPEVMSEQSKVRKFLPLKASVAFYIKIVVGLILFAMLVNGYYKNVQEERETDSFISSPKISDVYFLDFRVLSDDLRPREKYRLAKIVDITGDVITLRYSNVFYWQQQGLIDSIRYGQLLYAKFFEPKRYDFKISQLKSMRDSAAIFKVKRPKLNVLYGNYVNPAPAEDNSNLYIPGKRDNLAGLSLLKSTYMEDNFSQAFERFTRSAEREYAQGQVNLAQMYLNGQFVDKDLDKTLYWLKRASLKSDKAAILKYAIVCQQLSYCDLGDFYQELTNAGVNIKVRALDFTLSSDETR